MVDVLCLRALHVHTKKLMDQKDPRVWHARTLFLLLHALAYVYSALSCSPASRPRARYPESVGESHINLNMDGCRVYSQESFLLYYTTYIYFYFSFYFFCLVFFSFHLHYMQRNEKIRKRITICTYASLQFFILFRL